MRKYKIELKGCDGTTEFVMELTSGQAELVEKLGKLSEETSQYGCEPTLHIKEEK